MLLLHPQVLSLALAAAVSACSLGGDPAAPEPNPNAAVRVLFIGNSLTYFNDMPLMVKAFADSAGAPSTQVEVVAYPDFALEDHWSTGSARDALARQGWTHVVMQQGPSALESSRQNLLQWTGTFAAEIRKAGGVPGMYMVWPSAERSFDFDRVSESYRLAAESVDGQLYPAGDAWRAAWQRQANLPLYGGDGFHPSALGSYLAALTIYAVIHERSPVGLPAAIRVGSGTVSIPPATATLLQESAAEAVAAVASARRGRSG